MIISESVLPDLVRKTIVNASNLISELMDDSLSIDAKKKREKMILQISKKFEKFKTSDKRQRQQYYEYFFIDPSTSNYRKK